MDLFLKWRHASGAAMAWLTCGLVAFSALAQETPPDVEEPLAVESPAAEPHVVAEGASEVAAMAIGRFP